MYINQIEEEVSIENMQIYFKKAYIGDVDEWHIPIRFKDENFIQAWFGIESLKRPPCIEFVAFEEGFRLMITYDDKHLCENYSDFYEVFDIKLKSNELSELIGGCLYLSC